MAFNLVSIWSCWRFVFCKMDIYVYVFQLFMQKKAWLWCALFRIQLFWSCSLEFSFRMLFGAVLLHASLSLCAGGPALTLDWSMGITDPVDDYETVNFPPGSTPRPFVHWSSPSQTVPSTGRNYTIHIGSLSSGLPGAFSFQLPKGGCCHKAKVSATAKSKHCTYATNAGFFDKRGCCVGKLITNSSTEMWGATDRCTFGLNDDGFVLGYLKNSTIKDKKFLNMISGAGWLVRKGVSYINTSMTKEGLPAKFVSEKAPRTAIVVYKNGTLSLMQVDGEEDINEGLDLFELSEVLVQLGAWHAINLDGGGSSVSVLEDKVISQPTCVDIHLICERAVSSIACMKEL